MNKRHLGYLRNFFKLSDQITIVYAGVTSKIYEELLIVQLVQQSDSYLDLPSFRQVSLFFISDKGPV